MHKKHITCKQTHYMQTQDMLDPVLRVDVEERASRSNSQFTCRIYRVASTNSHFQIESDMYVRVNSVKCYMNKGVHTECILSNNNQYISKVDHEEEARTAIFGL